MDLEVKSSQKFHFDKIFQNLRKNGQRVSPRGLEVIEIENCIFHLPWDVRFMGYKARKLKLNYIKKEFLWYLRGDKFDTSICEHATMWKELINQDGSINSDYGQYFFGDEQQFFIAAKTLAEDKDSRRASVVILSYKHLTMETKDIPCTYGMNFRIRNNTLHASTMMRSQDSIFGLGNDLPCFQFLFEMMYVYLKRVYPELRIGNYCHYVNSFHLYERHYKMLDEIIESTDEDFEEIFAPQISSAEEVEFLCSKAYLDGIINIPEEYKFAKWLITTEEKGV